MTETLTADAVVVGSGVIGSAVALELARGGRSVLVLDKAGGPGHGSTRASSAVIRFMYSTFEGVATAWESKFCWETWADHLGLPGFEPLADPPALSRFHRTGMLHLDVPAVPREHSIDLLRAAGVPFEELGADELVARFPHLDGGAYWPNKPVADDAFWEETPARLGAVLTPDAGFMDDPRLAADNLAYAARLHGARTAYRAEVTGVERRGEVWHLSLADGRRVEAPVVVNAAGPWSGAFNAMAGVGAEFTVGVRPLRQEVHQVRQPDGLQHDGGLRARGVRPRPRHLHATRPGADLGRSAAPSPSATASSGSTTPTRSTTTSPTTATRRR